jgi:MFS family permease
MSNHAIQAARRAESRPTPLLAVMLFTWVNSLGSGIVTTGYSFLADSTYGFTPEQNYWLGLMQGVVYIAGALAVGPLLGRMLLRLSWLSTRAVLAGVMLSLAALCALPIVAAHSAGLEQSSWSLWILIGGYSTLTGVLWPIVESYLAGGRADAVLRRATGWFNVVWSSALVAAFWAMGPLKKEYSLELVFGVGVAHIACLALLPAFSRNPAAHATESHEPAPPIYASLLSVFRIQLVASYVVYSALTPILPSICEALGLKDHWETPIVSVWLAGRVLTFAVFQRWHGWHGRWSTVGWGAGLLVLGFASAVLAAPIARAAGAELGLVALVAGLATFGVAMGVVYSAALYYAMAVGSAAVDAGGKHESLIGLGYGGGPVCGLLAGAAVSGGLVQAARFEWLVLGLVSVVAIGMCSTALWRARRHAGHGA